MTRLKRVFALALLVALLLPPAGSCADLAEIRTNGVLRHLGIPYANFVTGAGDGMDVELMQRFAAHLGVRYEYVRTDWGTVVADLTGQQVKPKGNDVELQGKSPIKGDLIANGFTKLPWREKIVEFSTPTFPSQIWLIARADSSIRPIKPGNRISRDIAATKRRMKGKKVLAQRNTCLDPDIYNLQATGAEVIYFNGNLNEIAPAVINGEAEIAILDAPDALIALDKWPGKIKIIGPVSPQQEMAVAFPKNAHRLRDAFNRFLQQCKRDGSYSKLVGKYYPTATTYFPEFFLK